jgi:hypothetical protein
VDEIKIDKNIPVPSRGARRRYPIATMKIGDSFFVPGVEAQALSSTIANNRPKKFTRRTVVERGIRGVRVWRVK